MPQSTPQREPLPLLSTPSLDPKSHGAVQGAIEMVLIHNCFIRAMNSIYYHAPYVTEPKDIRDYLHFCATFVAVLFHHHDCEERFIFPPWAEATNCPDFMKDNHAEHRLFHDGVAQLAQYAKTTGPSAYRSDDLLTIMDGFAQPLATHLTNEIESLLSIQKYSSEVASKVFREGVKRATHGIDNTLHLPFIFGTHDKTFEGGKHDFPPIPFVLSVAMAWWFGYTIVLM